MSGSSPESGEFAARNRIKLGFAVTTLPLATKASQHYRRIANESGWDPCPEDIIYRVGIQVAETDEEAMERAAAQPPRRAQEQARHAVGASAPAARAGFSTSNMSVDDAVARSGYYGRDIDNQRGRVRMGGDLRERIENGQILCGGPDSILKQAHRLQDKTGAGVLDLVFGGEPEQVLRSIELFGTKVLPKLQEI
jgi:alkanesulfonate monooxygenase SsuD/methylene tetrahydromethanopterin reductase-like flavin-dependent oxidoreductase (luciferase family)